MRYTSEYTSQFCERRFVNHTVWWRNVAACIEIYTKQNKKKKEKKKQALGYFVYLTNKRR